MKKRLHDKKAGTLLLTALILISLAEVIFRAIAIREAVLSTANLGEQLAVIIFATIILIMTANGKDRACYLCYGAWLAYFVLDQFFELPGTIATFIARIATQGDANIVDFPAIPGSNLAMILQMLSMAAIIAIGVLLVEYLNDKSIYNKAFNILSFATVLMILVGMGIDTFNLISLGYMPNIILTLFSSAYRLTMVILFTFFAYDSAKNQLKKVNLNQ